MVRVGEIRQLIEEGHLEKAELLFRECSEISKELKALWKELRTKLARLCERPIEGFDYIGCYSYQCNEHQFQVHEYHHRQTGLDFILLPPVGVEIPFQYNQGSSSRNLEQLYYNQDPTLFVDDVMDAYLPDDENEHPIVLTHPFLIAKSVVTREIWQKIMNTSPWEKEESKIPSSLFPATSISWEDCQRFCEKTGLEFPSEAQWEYACRSGSSTLYYWGNKMDPDYAWYYGNTYKVEENYVHLVKEKKKNAFGLCDMSGNVNEWCFDFYGDYPDEKSVDPIGELTGEKKVLRGGSFFHYEENLRSAERSSAPPFSQQRLIGFRPGKWLT